MYKDIFRIQIPPRPYKFFFIAYGPANFLAIQPPFLYFYYNLW